MSSATARPSEAAARILLEAAKRAMGRKSRARFEAGLKRALCELDQASGRVVPFRRIAGSAAPNVAGRLDAAALADELRRLVDLA